MPFDGTLKKVDVTYDMVHGALVSESWSNTTGNPNGTLALALSTVPLDRKTPTYLWLPDDNSTVNGLPPGLERYTGEQSFDLVVINASASLTSVSIPYPWGGSYTIPLQPGLNNLLFPREQFLNSPFATAVFEGKNFPYPSSHPTPPILSSDSTARSLLTQSFGSASGLMFDLEAYWQNRSIASPPGNFTTAETGVSSSSPLQVRTMVVQTTLANNTGGLASNPSIYSSVPMPPSLEAIVTLNITSTATFDLLLSALLTNTTAGVNGTFQTVTNQVASLGLDAPVLSALANAPVISQGLYGPPTHNKAPPSAGGIWGDFWNAFSAVVTTITGAIVSIVGEVYSVAVAATTYLNRIANEAAAIGAQVLARTAAAIVHVGQLIVRALDQLLSGPCPNCAGGPQDRVRTDYRSRGGLYVPAGERLPTSRQ